MRRPLSALTLVALAWPAAAVPRPAVDRFDGTWSVEIITDSGTCDRAYRYPIRVQQGQARFVGTAFTISGGVDPKGGVKGSISNGMATAQVVGRLRRDGSGTGTWVATGTLECRGHWSAERRG